MIIKISQYCAVFSMFYILNHLAIYHFTSCLIDLR